MRVEEERCDGERQHSNPEVDQVRRPQGQGDIEQQDQGTESKVDRGSGESRVQDAKRDPGRGESSSGCNVSGSSEVQIVQDRVRVYLGGEHLEYRRQRHEVLGQSDNGTACATFRQLLQEEWQEGDEEDDENRDDASLNPLVNGDQVVATGLSGSNLSVRVVPTDEQFLVHRTQEGQNDHEHLNREDNQDVVDVESRMTVVECKEPIDRQLRSQVVVLSTEHLLSHTSSNLGLEIENGTETQITTFTTLVVFRMLDPSASSKCVHTGVNILVQVQTLLSLGDTASSVHVDGVQEIRVTIVQLSTNPRERTSSQGSESLFLSGGNVSKDTNVL